VSTTYVYLELGSNLGERAQYLAAAKELLTRRVGECVRASSIYESEPWGFESDTSFLNQVVVLSTTLTPEDLLKAIAAIEHDLGRVRSPHQRYSSRTIDIDILLYGDRIIDSSPNLIVPHPRMSERRFVLLPMIEVAPTGRHPLLNITWQELLTQCNDTGWVTIWKPESTEKLSADSLVHALE